MNTELWAAIRRLREVEKLSRSSIARRLGIHRRTVGRALASPLGPPVDLPRRATRAGRLDPHKDYLRRRLQDYPELSGRKLFIELRRLGYAGGYTILKEFLRTIRPSAPAAFLRIETQPGELAQVDWANIGTIQIGNAKRKLSCFVMVLSFSRMMYLELTLSQCLEDFLACHVNAFRFFGGIVKSINYDNLKTVVLSRAGSEIRFHPRFLDFAGYYLFDPVPCAARSPWQKGKVENGIKYVRSAFLAGRPLLNLPQLREDAGAWLSQEANVRVHGTTRERPWDRFLVEQPLLGPLPPTDYECAIVRSLPASKQCLVQFETNRYTVPSGKANRMLTLKATGQTVCLFDGPDLAATHPRSYEKYRVIENPAHYARLVAERKKARAAKRVEAFLALGPESEAYLKGLVAAELHLPSHLDKILELVANHGKAEVLSAVRHALGYNAFSASYIQNILRQREAARNRPHLEPIRLSKKPDWAEAVVEETDLGIYDDIFEQSRGGKDVQGDVP